VNIIDYQFRIANIVDGVAKCSCLVDKVPKGQVQCRIEEKKKPTDIPAEEN